MPFRRTRIFFAVFGAYLLVAVGIRINWFARGGGSGPEFGSLLFDYGSLVVIALSGVVLAAASGQAHDLKRMGRIGALGSLLFLAQEACALAIAWHWHPQNATVSTYRHGVLISRTLLAAVGVIASVQAVRVLLAATAAERAPSWEQSNGGPASRNPPFPSHFEG
jgi:hypothetical protein